MDSPEPGSPESSTLYEERFLSPTTGKSRYRSLEGFRMARTVWFRSSVVLVLLLLLAPAVFAKPRPAKLQPRELGAFAWITQVLGHVFPPGLKSGGTMNPDGKPQLASPPAIATSDSGGTMDPDGRK
jgi:hypothetical protein